MLGCDVTAVEPSPQGRLSGCCDGKGGWEDCIEQHITGDVGVAVRHFWHATGDVAWLASRGWPILQGVAEFIVARVTPTNADNTTFALNKVMPVDEW